MIADELLRLKANCDCAIVTSPAALYRLSGFECADAIIVATDKERVYLTDSRYEIAAKKAVDPDLTIKILSRREQMEYLRSAVRSASRVGVEYRHLTLAWYFNLFGDAPRDTVNLSLAMDELRIRKNVAELAIIKRAEDIVDQTFCEVKSLLKVGVTEREISLEIMERMMRKGAQGPAFDTIVAFGENAAMPHAVPSDRALREGDCVLMDFGAKYKGYCSDFTRTLFYGEPTSEFRAAYDMVLEAQKAAIAYLEQGGRNCAEADASARKVIDGSPFKGTFNHSLGHGVGLEIHESPSLSALSQGTLKGGMVFTLEPGIYLEGKFGIRIESLVALENGKLTVIDRSDKENYTV